MAKKLMELVREVLAKGETEEGRRELREQRGAGGGGDGRGPPDRRRPLRRLQRLRRRPRTCPRRPLEDLTRPKGRLRCGRSSGSVRSSRWWSKLSKKPPSRRPDRGRVGALPPSEGEQGTAQGWTTWCVDRRGASPRFGPWPGDRAARARAARGGIRAPLPGVHRGALGYLATGRYPTAAPPQPSSDPESQTGGGRVMHKYEIISLLEQRRQCFRGRSSRASWLYGSWRHAGLRSQECQ